jgi:hypothetical protein
VLNFKERRIEYYDSLGEVDRKTINNLLKWVEDEYADKYKKPLPTEFQVKPAAATDSFVLMFAFVAVRMQSHSLQCIRCSS